MTMFTIKYFSFRFSLHTLRDPELLKGAGNGQTIRILVEELGTYPVGRLVQVRN